MPEDKHTLIVPPIESLAAPYHGMYLDFLAQVARRTGAAVRVHERYQAYSAAFEFSIVDSPRCLMDFSDYGSLPAPNIVAAYPHVFKFHYLGAYGPEHANVRPFSPISFHDWSAVTSLRPWSPDVSMILHKQAIDVSRPDLAKRRSKARSILQSFLKPEMLDTAVVEQSQFFSQSENCLASVHIPGSWEHLLDRGQLQLMALGVCTISPDLWTVTAGGRPQPFVHYLPIRDDFSDLKEKVQWCYGNRGKCYAIGNQARQWFMERLYARPLWRYLLDCLLPPPKL